MKRTIFATMVLGLAALALATSTFNKTFNTTYRISAESNLGKAKCSICHVKATGGKLNKYGLDVKSTVKDGKITAAGLKSIESKDSDGDGKKNGAEIKADSNPGK